MSSIPPPGTAGAHPEPFVPRPPIGDEERPAWRLWMAPAAIVIGFAVGEFFAIVIGAIGSAGGSSFEHPSPAVSIISDVAVDLAFVGAALYFTVLQGRSRPRDFGFSRVDFGRGLAAFAAAGVGYYALTYVYASLFALHGSDKLPSELGVNRSTVALVAAAVFVCVIAPIAEEFFFRGFLFGTLRQMQVRVAGHELGTWIAALIVAVLFGLAHTGSASSRYLVPLGFLGFVLCLIRWRTGSLYPCMALHAFNNALALGYNELHWSAAAIVGLIAGSLALISVLTAPLAGRAPAPA
jgi:CAAX protease family protein